MERLTFNLRPVATGTPLEPAQAPQAAAAVVREPERDVLAFRALLAFMVVMLVRPQDQVPALAALHLADLTAATALVALIVGRMGRGQPVTRSSPEVSAVLAFAAVMIVTIPLSLWPTGSFVLLTDQFLKIVLIFLVIANTLTSRDRVRTFVTVVVLCATYVAGRAVVDYVRGANLIEDGRVAGAVGGLFGNPNDMALNMVTFLPLAVALVVDRARPMTRWLGLLAVPLMALAVVFTKSRGGFVGLAIMVVVLLFYMRRLRPGIAVLILFGALATVPLLPSSFTERMASIFSAEQDPTGSRQARKTLLAEGWHAFLDRPLTGLGAGQFQNYKGGERDESWRQTHNAPLQVASELGIVGLAVFMLMMWSGLSAGWQACRTARVIRRRRSGSRPPTRRGRGGSEADPADWLDLYGATLVAGLVGWFVAANFASVAYYWTLYLMLGLATALRTVTLRMAQSHEMSNVAPSLREVA